MTMSPTRQGHGPLDLLVKIGKEFFQQRKEWGEGGSLVRNEGEQAGDSQS